MCKFQFSQFRPWFSQVTAKTSGSSLGHTINFYVLNKDASYTIRQHANLTDSFLHIYNTINVQKISELTEVIFTIIFLF